MCEFFSCLLLRNQQIVFTESNHHSIAIERARLFDCDLPARQFVRLENPPPFQCLRIDETGTLPGWFDERYGDPNTVDGVLLIEDIACRVRAIAEQVANIIKRKNVAYEAAQAWEAEQRQRLDAYELADSQGFNLKAAFESRRQFDIDKARRQLAIVHDYEIGFRSMDGYLPPSEGMAFIHSEDEGLWRLTGQQYASMAPAPVQRGQVQRSIFSAFQYQAPVAIPPYTWQSSGMKPTP
jgi:hypothetical protein